MGEAQEPVRGVLYVERSVPLTYCWRNRRIFVFFRVSPPFALVVSDYLAIIGRADEDTPIFVPYTGLDRPLSHILLPAFSPNSRVGR